MKRTFAYMGTVAHTIELADGSEIRLHSTHQQIELSDEQITPHIQSLITHAKLHLVPATTAPTSTGNHS